MLQARHQYFSLTRVQTHKGGGRGGANLLAGAGSIGTTTIRFRRRARLDHATTAGDEITTRARLIRIGARSTRARGPDSRSEDSRATIADDSRDCAAPSGAAAVLPGARSALTTSLAESAGR